jgi:hypothetical protein
MQGMFRGKGEHSSNRFEDLLAETKTGNIIINIHSLEAISVDGGTAKAESNIVGKSIGFMQEKDILGTVIKARERGCSCRNRIESIN